MKRMMVALALILALAFSASAQSGEKIGDYITTTIPVFGDTLTITATAIDTSGVIAVQTGGVFSITTWADSLGAAGTVDIKVEYQIMQFDTEYVTSVTEATSTVHPVGRVVKSGATLYPVKNTGSWWTTIWSSLNLYDERDTKSIQPPLCDYLRLRITGNAANGDSTKVKCWVRTEP